MSGGNTVEITASTISSDAETFRSAARAIETAISSATSTLNANAGMAGDDNAAEIFNEGDGGYDATAKAVLQSAQSIANGYWILAAALENTANTYAAAQLPGAGEKPSVTPVSASEVREPSERSVSSSLGPGWPGALGEMQEVIEWGLQQVGVVIPTGDEDKLRSGAGAWSDFAQALDSAKTTASGGLSWIGALTVPQAAQVEQSQRGLATSLTNLRPSAVDLEDRLNGFIEELQLMRERLKDLLQQLALELAADLALTGLLSLFTFGLGAIAGSAKAALTVVKFAKLIKGLIDKLKDALKGLKGLRGIGARAALRAGKEGVQAGISSSFATSVMNATHGNSDSAGDRAYQQQSVTNAFFSAMVGGAVASPVTRVVGGNPSAAGVRAVTRQTAGDTVGGVADGLASGLYEFAQDPSQGFNPLSAAVGGAILGGTMSVVGRGAEAGGGAALNGARNLLGAPSRTPRPTGDGTAPAAPGGSGAPRADFDGPTPGAGTSSGTSTAGGGNGLRTDFDGPTPGGSSSGTSTGGGGNGLRTDFDGPVTGAGGDGSGVSGGDGSPVSTPDVPVSDASTGGDATTPDVTTPDATTGTPDATTPDVTSGTPDATTPDVTSGTPDATTPDVTSGTPDATTGTPDATTGTPDATTPDVTSGTPDATTPDATPTTPDTTTGTPDATTGTPDATTPDVTSGTPDATTSTTPDATSGTPDATTGTPDATTPEATSGTPDAITPDATTGTPDATTPDATTPDTTSGTPDVVTTPVDAGAADASTPGDIAAPDADQISQAASDITAPAGVSATSGEGTRATPHDSETYAAAATDAAPADDAAQTVDPATPTSENPDAPAGDGADGQPSDGIDPEAAAAGAAAAAAGVVAMPKLVPGANPAGTAGTHPGGRTDATGPNRGGPQAPTRQILNPLDPSLTDAGSGDGWTRVEDPTPASADDSNYGQPRQDHGELDPRYGRPPMSDLDPAVRDLVTDPDAPYGRDENGNALTQQQWEQRYVDADGDLRYPPNQGGDRGSFVHIDNVDTFRDIFGGQFDRMGGPGGGYFSVPGTPFEARALPPGNLRAPYSVRDLTSLPEGAVIEVSTISPGFGHPGGGVQFRVIDPNGTNPNGTTPRTYSQQQLENGGHLTQPDAGSPAATTPGVPPTDGPISDAPADGDADASSADGDHTAETADASDIDPSRGETGSDPASGVDRSTDAVGPTAPRPESLVRADALLEQFGGDFDFTNPDHTARVDCGFHALNMFDAMNGRPVQDVGTGPVTVAEVEARTGVPQTPATPSQIEASLRAMGPDSTVVVGIDRSTGMGHWFNAHFDGERVWALDPQTGERGPWPPDEPHATNWDVSMDPSDVRNPDGTHAYPESSDADPSDRGAGDGSRDADREAALDTVPERHRERAERLYSMANNSHLEPHLRNFARGELFNLQQHDRFPANEVYVDVLDADGEPTGQRVRLDSYSPGTEVVSRKHTQFADLVNEESGIRHLKEFLAKYPTGNALRVVADVPSARSNPALSARIGEPLDGRMILEVPVQDAPIPQSIIDLARDNRITIRDVEGRRYA